MEDYPRTIQEFESRYSTEEKPRPFFLLMESPESSIMSVESIPRGKGFQERLSIRFPILGGRDTPDTMDCIGTIGFDYRVIKKGIELLRDTSGPSQLYAFLLSGDPDSLKGFPIYV